MNRSDAIDALAAALAVAQGQMEGAYKASSNPFFKSRYADLASVWQACRKPLSDNGLAVVQSVRVEHPHQYAADVAVIAQAVAEKAVPPNVIVTTLLAHNSGQWISEELTMQPRENSPQAIGSCTSYARRYALAAMVGVFQMDDDAEQAEGRQVYVEYGLAGGRGEQEGLKDVINALTADDPALMRSTWNDINAVGHAAGIWRVLNTKQKKHARDLLQKTEAPVPPHAEQESQANGNGDPEGP